jgi:SH3-like domain-containing protein
VLFLFDPFKELVRMFAHLAIRNVLVFAVLSSVLALAPAWAQEWVSIRNDNVNMRTGPSTSSEVLWNLAKGYPLQVQERKNNWLRVKDFEGDTGWVSANVTSKDRHHIVKGKKINVRSGPSTNHRLVGSVEYGEVLRTIKRQGQWVEVRLPNGRTGWVASNLVWGW